MKILLRILILTYFLIGLTNSKAFSQGSNDYIIKQLKVKDGLSQSSIFSILQDRHGYMWFGTGSGLNKYDGYTFKVYLNNPMDSTSISDNGVSSLYEDHEGYIWAGTSGGVLNRFDRRSETFERYNITSLEENNESIGDYYYEYPILYSRNSDNSVTSISEDEHGNIWAGTWGRGIYVLDKKTGSFINYYHDKDNPNSLSFNRVTRILIDSQKQIWIATFGGGLNKYRHLNLNSHSKGEAVFHSFKNNPKDNYSLSDNKVTSLFEDMNGNLWIGTFNGGLNKLNSKTRSDSSSKRGFQSFRANSKNENALSDNSVMSLTEDASGYIWIGTFGGGLNRLNPRDNSVIHFMHDNLDENTIADNDIISLYKDYSGIIWAGTHLGEGISQLEQKSIKFDLISTNPMQRSSLNDDVVWSILKDKNGIVWIGTYRGGLNRFNDITKTFSYYKNIPGNSNSLSNNHVRSLAEDSAGNLWIGTYAGGLNKLDKNGKFTHYKYSALNSTSIGGNQIQKLYIDANSVMWIAVFGGGLNSLDLKNLSSDKPNFIKYKNIPNDPTTISDNRVYTIYEDRQNNLWVGTFGGGLNKFDKKNRRFERFQTDPQNPFSLQNNKILCLYEDKAKNFWVGTSGSGLLKFNRENKKFTRYGLEHNIDADIIYGILEDEEQNLWISSSNGIYKYSILTESSTQYDVMDGVQSLEFSGGAYFKAANGEMFFGGISGLNRFFPNKVKNNSYIPPVMITSIKAANQYIKGEIRKLELAHNQNFLTFEFAALSYSDPMDNKYSYMLDGFDDNWKNVDAKYRVANYTNLPPGEYVFKVRGANQDGIWNPIDTKIFIIINPPFWKSWWFTALSILLASAAIYYLGSIRTRNELAIEKLKTKLAADLHDNIGAGLTEISILSELVNNEVSSTSSGNVLTKLKNISEVARQLVDSMSDIVWVVNPKRDSLKDLLVRLKDSYSDILNSYGISFKIINMDKIENLTLSMDYKQNLYLIFKEGINNAIKHSKCSKMILEANVRNNILELSLHDNGIGLNQELPEYGNGIKNIEDRCNNLGGKFKWKSSTEKGTTIKFIGEIKKINQFNKILKSFP